MGAAVVLLVGLQLLVRTALPCTASCSKKVPGSIPAWGCLVPVSAQVSFRAFLCLKVLPVLTWVSSAIK